MISNLASLEKALNIPKDYREKEALIRILNCLEEGKAVVEKQKEF